MVSNNTWVGLASVSVSHLFSDSFSSSLYETRVSFQPWPPHYPPPPIFFFFLPQLSFALLSTKANNTVQCFHHQRSIFPWHRLDFSSPLQQILLLFSLCLSFSALSTLFIFSLPPTRFSSPTKCKGVDRAAAILCGTSTTPFSRKGKATVAGFGLPLSCSANPPGESHQIELLLCVICKKKKKIVMTNSPCRCTPCKRFTVIKWPSWQQLWLLQEFRHRSPSMTHLLDGAAQTPSRALNLSGFFQGNLAARETLVSNKCPSDAGCQINPNLSMST